MAMFRVTNYMNIRDLMEDRISTQIVFNFSILLNMFVIINYIIQNLEIIAITMSSSNRLK